MTLVEELRAEAAKCRLAAIKSPLDQPYHDGGTVAYEDAAKRLEADPLFIAAPKMRDYLERVVRDYSDWPDLSALVADARAILATLPKEAP